MITRRFSTRFELSTRSTTVVSAVLGTLLYLLGIYATRGTYKPGHTVFGVQIQVLSPYISLSLLAVGLLVPWLLKLYAFLDSKMRPRPGVYAFPADVLASLAKSFSVERDRIEEATVPSHLPSAKPASSSLAVHLGDASFVLPSSDQRTIREFIGRPRNPKLAATSSRQVCEREVLVITGEPGGGKSVILQELHASLSYGVDKGFHSFIPIIVFARDLTLAALTDAEQDQERPLQTFLSRHYARRCAQSPSPNDLRPLQALLNHSWDRLDFLILFDGLDEIAQRSVYETIQQTLVRFILKDLQSGRQGVHRFVLSCRTDEDLELFRDAQKVFLRGLTTERDRERFCEAVIAQASATPLSRRSIEKALTSRRLVPDHVFKRNPYFLALLVGHLRDDQDITDEALDFDYLMRKYLEREAYRPYASLRGQSNDRLEARRGLFNELETIARFFLQFLAFRCSSSVGIAGLYDEIAIDETLIKAFIDETDRASSASGEDTCWGAVSKFLDELTLRPTHLSSDHLQEFVLAGHLHENDVRVLRDLAMRTQGSLIADEAVFLSFGFVPFRGLLEEEGWYRALAQNIWNVAAKMALSPRQGFALLLFSRSLVAAHVLRILWITSNRSVFVRFRHRRLAEYYAACFLRNRWRDLGTPAFTPWLAPIMNLTCAIEGARCWALRWLVDRISRIPSEPRYEWRYGVEVAVEAAFFAQPGQEYSRCVCDLLSVVLLTLQNYGLHSTCESDVPKIDIVTELTLVRAVDNLSRLRAWTGALPVHEQAVQGFRTYEGVQPAEWIAEFAAASRSVTVLTGRRAPAGNRLKTFWKLIQQPSAMLSSPKWRAGIGATKVGVWISIVVGEAILFTAFVAIVVTGMKLFASPGVSRSEFQSARLSLIVFASVPWLAMRCQGWMRSPSRAAFWSSAVWRLAPSTLKSLRVIVQPGLFLGKLLQHLFESSWRHAPALGVGLVLVSAIGFGILRMTDIKWFKSDVPRNEAAKRPADKGQTKPAEVEPCPQVDAAFQRILGNFNAFPKVADPNQILQVRQSLTRELANLKKTNERERCGNESADGWVLAEDRVADILYERDNRLVPLPEQKEGREMSATDAQRMAALVTGAPPTDPPAGPVGSIMLFQRRREVADRLKELKQLRIRAIESRRSGAVGRLKDIEDHQPGKLPAKSLIESADQELKALTNIQVKLESRGNVFIIWLIAGVVPALLLLSVAIQQYSKYRNRKRLLTALRTASVAGLCVEIEKPSNSEWMRREIVRSIGNRENIAESDLTVIEQTAQHLHGCNSIIDKELALSVADLATAVAKRLHHRITADMPRRLITHSD